MMRAVTGASPETRYYLVDDRNPSRYAQVFEELVADGAGNLFLSRVYNHGSGLLSETLIDPTTHLPTSTFYYGYDGHGNVRFLMDLSGAVTDTYSYDAFGILINKTPLGTGTPNNYLYCGEQFDFWLGMYYLRARYCNPQTGRFWTMDAYEGNDDDPSSLHKYLYSQGNPVNGSDPSGEQTEVAEAIGEAIAGTLGSLIQSAVSAAARQATLKSGETILIERYKKAKAHLEGRNVKHHGKRDASCYSVNQPIGKFLGPPPSGWTVRLEHRGHWYGFPFSTLTDHWGVVARTSQPQFKELLFDYWDDRPAGENPKTWFRVRFEGLVSGSFDYTYSPTATPEDYRFLDTIPVGAD